MESLIKIDGEPLAKLIDVVANAIGKWYEPRHMVRMASAEAKAEHIKTIEKVKREALLNHNEDLYNHLSVVEKRLVTKESKRQQNIEQVVNRAANVLFLETEVSSENVDPDWITRFFDIAQDISNEQMQELWGRVLAGEVKQPGAFSLRTLEALRNVTSEEAQLFENIACYVFHYGRCYIYNGLLEDGYEDLQYGAIICLMEMGVIQSVTDAGIILKQKGEKYDHLYIFGDYVYLFSFPDYFKELRIPVYPLTLSGCELFKLTNTEPNYDYFHSVIKRVINKDTGVKVYRTKILSIDNQGVKYDNNSLEQLDV